MPVSIDFDGAAMLPTGISSSSFGALVARQATPRSRSLASIVRGQPISVRTWSRNCLSGIAVFGSILRRVWPGVLSGYSPQEPGPPAAAGTIELPDLFKML